MFSFFVSNCVVVYGGVACGLNVCLICVVLCVSALCCCFPFFYVFLLCACVLVWLGVSVGFACCL